MADQIDNTLLVDSSGFPRSIDVGSDSIVLSTDLTLQAGGIFASDNIKRGTADPVTSGVLGNEGDLYQQTQGSTGALWVNLDGTSTGWERAGSNVVGLFPTIWRFRAPTTAANPGNGNFRLNSATFASVTEIYISSVNRQGLNLDNLLNLVRTGTRIFIQDSDDASQLLFVEVSSVTNNTGWWTIGVTFLTAIGSSFSGRCLVIFQYSIDPLSTVLNSGASTEGTSIIVSSGDSLVGESNASGNGGDLPLVGGDSTGGGGNGGNVVITPGSGNATGVDGVVEANGVRHYANSATNPTSPSPSDGDRYYNTALNMEMRYDGGRGKWLSVDSTSFMGSNLDELATTEYLEHGNMRMSASSGFTALYDGTVVGLSWTRSDTDAMNWGVTAGGSTISTVPSSAVAGKDRTLNNDFNEDDVLAVRNDGVGTPSNSIVWVQVKWRVS